MLRISFKVRARIRSVPKLSVMAIDRVRVKIRDVVWVRGWVSVSVMIRAGFWFRLISRLMAGTCIMVRPSIG